jgi:hypothetical protein
MQLPQLDNRATIEAQTIVLTPAQRALLLTFRRVLLSALALVDQLLGKA